MNTTLLDLTVQIFNSTGTQEVVGVRTPAMVDARGYPVTEQGLGNVNVNGLITPVGPCPNGRAYAICVLQEPALIASTTTAPAATPTMVAPAAPSTTAAAATPTVPVAPSTTAAPAAPPTTVAPVAPATSVG